MGLVCKALRVGWLALGIIGLASAALTGTTSQELIEPEISDKDRSHWAFQPVHEGQLPEVDNTGRSAMASTISYWPDWKRTTWH